MKRAPDLPAMIAAAKARIAARDAVISALCRDDRPVRFAGPDAMRGIVTPDMAGDAAWRIIFLRGALPTGHCCGASKDEVLRIGYSAGMTPVLEEETT